ncbi:uncharacterized protein A4U43_C05F31610 [Asparagus officinalis]|uniref:Uncharacterized protein n=1 Tax=Asparagus officinalis TaxID=4686 RepID=A0A5P1F0I0_ASPOF|nr:uncharacterized protein A4U43_C05F31610 [Asparagus officinalis]
MCLSVVNAGQGSNTKIMLVVMPKDIKKCVQLELVVSHLLYLDGVNGLESDLELVVSHLLYLDGVNGLEFDWFWKHEKKLCRRKEETRNGDSGSENDKSKKEETWEMEE